MSHQPPDGTLADYVHVIRRSKRTILLVGIVCAALALVVSLLQTPTYQAQASESVRDPNQDLSLTGTAYITGATPLQLAAAHAPLVTRLTVANAVKRRLKTPMSPAELQSAVSVSIDPNSYLVLVTAHSENAGQAAAIANAFVDADAAQTTAAARANYGRLATELQRRIGPFSRGGNAVAQAGDLETLARLQSLSSVAVPVQVDATAPVPSSPSSPQPVRNTLAALLFGLLLGTVIVFVREAIDQRLRRSTEVERLCPEPIVGHLRADALGRVGAHADGRSNGNRPLEPSDQEALRIVRHNVNYLPADEQIRTLLVTSPVAQEGKSTVAAGLAAMSAMAGKRTLLVECDLRRPVLAKRLGIPAQPGLTDYLTGRVEPKDILKPVPTLTASTNGNRRNGTDGASHAEHSLTCIAAGRPAPGPGELLASERFAEFLAEVSEAYDAVILDCAPLLSVADTLEIVPVADAALLCLRLGRTTRAQARSAHQALARLPRKPTAIVLTNVHRTDERYYGHDDAPAAAGV
jgi:Mrp family chromosome partitioning ATPase/capsular polysaccharide biosynthesis protein